MKKKLPAYAKRWMAEREAGRAPARMMVVTRAWIKDPLDWQIVIPGDEDPEQYDYSIVAGLGCVVHMYSGNIANAVFVSCIEEAGPRQAMVYLDQDFACWIPR